MQSGKQSTPTEQVALHHYKKLCKCW